MPQGWLADGGGLQMCVPLAHAYSRRAQNPLAGCIFVGVADKSAFALLSQKVTKAMRRIRRSLPDREKGKLIEADNQRYDRERLCQPQQQKIPCKEH